MPSIAVMVTKDSYGLSILRGIARFAADHPEWEFARRTTLPILDNIGGWQGDGMIGQFRALHPELQVLHRRGTAIVNVSHAAEGLPFPSVGPDDPAIGNMGAHYFLERGFRNFGFVGFFPHWYSRERRRGFREVLHRAGRDCSVCPEPPGSALVPASQKWLRCLPKPVAVMACNDIRGRQIIEACMTEGLRVPEDVAVLGVDNDEWQALMAHTPLSTIEPNPLQIGFEAARILAGLLGNRRRSSRTSHIKIAIPPLGVITRKSTDAVTSDDPLVAQALAYLHEHSNTPMTVPAVIAALSVSRRQLETKFRKHLGRTPQEAIWQAHVQRAQRLLVETDHPLKNVAASAGFPNAERFSYVFRRETGFTPGQYRATFRLPGQDLRTVPEHNPGS